MFCLGASSDLAAPKEESLPGTDMFFKSQHCIGEYII